MRAGGLPCKTPDPCQANSYICMQKGALLKLLEFSNHKCRLGYHDQSPHNQTLWLLLYEIEPQLGGSYWRFHCFSLTDKQKTDVSTTDMVHETTTV